jgi:hypothetical protein
MNQRWNFVGMIALAVGIPRAIEAQRQSPRVPVEDQGTEQRLAAIERKLEGLAGAMETRETKRIEGGDEKARLVERRLSDVERRLSDSERKLSNFLREWERIKRR